jgi:hypothetical protein
MLKMKHFVLSMRRFSNSLEHLLQTQFIRASPHYAHLFRYPRSHVYCSSNALGAKVLLSIGTLQRSISRLVPLFYQLPDPRRFPFIAQLHGAPDSKHIYLFEDEPIQTFLSTPRQSSISTSNSSSSCQ